MAIFFFFLGGIVAFIGLIMMWVAAFRESIWWGLAFFIPGGALVFGALHWQEVKKPFLTYLGGTAVVFFALVINLAMTPKPATESAATTSAATSTVTTAAALTTTTSFTAPRFQEPVYHPPSPARPLAPPEEPIKRLEQVWVDGDTGRYYSEKCARHPESAYRVAKSIAIKKGFVPAACP